MPLIAHYYKIALLKFLAVIKLISFHLTIFFFEVQDRLSIGFGPIRIRSCKMGFGTPFLGWASALVEGRDKPSYGNKSQVIMSTGGV